MAVYQSEQVVQRMDFQISLLILSRGIEGVITELYDKIFNALIDIIDIIESTHYLNCKAHWLNF